MRKFQIGHGDVHWNIADSSLLCGTFRSKDNFTSPTNTLWKANEIITKSTIVLREFSCNTGWRGVLDKPRDLGKSIKTRRLARALRESWKFIFALMNSFELLLVFWRQPQGTIKRVKVSILNTFLSTVVRARFYLK